MKDDSGDGIFFVRVNRTALQTGRLDAMIAPHRKMKSLSVGVGATLQFADLSPLQVRRIVVLFVAGHLAAVAPDATGHIEVEAVLLAGTGFGIWNTLGGGKATDPGARGN